MALSVMCDVLGADLGAALGDVAVADAVLVLELGHAVLGVERVHLELGRVDEEARADELLVLAVIAKDVADILAEEALDALPEFLDAVDVALRHPPRAIGLVGRTRLELLDALFHAEVPRDMGRGRRCRICCELNPISQSPSFAGDFATWTKMS